VRKLLLILFIPIVWLLADSIGYIDARSNDDSNPIQIELDKGVYRISVESGAWTAWSDKHLWSTTASASTSSQTVRFGSGWHSTAAEALLNSESATITLESEDILRLYILDYLCMIIQVVLVCE